MSALDRLLRGEEESAPAAPMPLQLRIAILLAAGACYGAVMGSFGGMRFSQMICSAVKVPLLLTATFWLSLPMFFVLSSLVGLRADFRQSLAALAGAQAALTVILAALAPFTAFIYVSGLSYPDAILFNGMMFAIASCGGQIVLRRSYRELIRRNANHRRMLRLWLIVYIFV